MILYYVFSQRLSTVKELLLLLLVVVVDSMEYVRSNPATGRDIVVQLTT